MSVRKIRKLNQSKMKFKIESENKFMEDIRSIHSAFSIAGVGIGALIMASSRGEKLTNHNYDDEVKPIFG